MTRILIVGAGNVGGHLLEFLARDEDDFIVTVGDVDVTKAQQAVHNALVGGIKHGRYQQIEAVEVDLKDIDRTAELVASTKPHVIINCAVMQTWHRIRALPQAHYERLSSATLGAWLPVQLLLPYRLAQAIEMSETTAPFINTSLSDLTNPALATVGLAPSIGIGNVDVIAPAIQLLAANRLGIDRESITVSLVAHHVHWVFPREAGYRDGAPFRLRIEVNGADVTGEFNPDNTMVEAVKLFPPGINFTTVSASSAINNAKALVSKEEVATHAPGPNGLPGGYPVKITAGRVTTNLPSDLNEEQAVKINEEAQRYDGIASINADGVEFMDYTQEIMSDMLGFTPSRFAFDDLEDVAEEQLHLYREFERRVM